MLKKFHPCNFFLFVSIRYFRASPKFRKQKKHRNKAKPATEIRKIRQKHPRGIISGEGGMEVAVKVVKFLSSLKRVADKNRENERLLGFEYDFLGRKVRIGKF